MRALNRDGFVLSYLSAITAEDFQSSLTDRNQLRLEARLRKSISTEKPEKLAPLSIEIGKSVDKAVWEPYYAHGSIFVDRSSFYSVLNKIRMHVATTLISEEEQTVDAVLWTYMSTGVYVNGELSAEIKYPVYKPIESVRFSLSLQKGRNDIVFVSDNLGVRDTRNMLAFQILNGKGILSTIPDSGAEEEYGRTANFLDEIKIGRGELHFASPAPNGTKLIFSKHTDDYTEKASMQHIKYISGLSSVSVPEGFEKAAVVIGAMKRSFEFSERIQPEYLPPMSSSDRFREILRRIGNVAMLDRGDHGFALFAILARKYLGIERGDEIALIRNDISLIKRRGDCSDFLVCALLRYIHEYGLPESVKDEAFDALTSFRYWMTMKGADGMCFWSENHSLMFYYSACDAGSLYPDAYFERAGMTGKELHAYGERRVEEWLDDVLEQGYEEFLSSTYMCVTFAVLLNVIDYCKPEISKKAWQVTDRILKMLAESTFDGAVIAPMGRVYRGVIYPYRECVAALMSAISGDAAYAYGEGWLAFLASSSYKFPSGLESLMKKPLEKKYSTGNAMVSIEKTESYMLTAVESPRCDESFRRWQNTMDDDSVDAEDNHFVKSLNECFHGTSCFQPGVYGYQQHMWTAALSSSALVFVNHPGTTSEEAELRPGYWNGNGVMPSIAVQKGTLAAIYSIPENHPVGFTHLYIPFFRFREHRECGNWIFLAERKGYLAIWKSGEMQSYDDEIASSELRLYARKAAYLVKAGSSSESSFDDFIENTLKLDVEFSEKEMKLYVDGEAVLDYVPVDDRTQYLD